MPSEATAILLRGGRLATAAQHDADSLLVEGGRIAWIGAAKDAPRADRVIDLDGSRVVAGLTDAHAHLFMRAQELLNLQLGPAANSIAELLKRLRAACEAAASDEWVMSADYSEQFLAERRHPTREELDSVSGGRPVLLRRTGGHLSVANSAALQRAHFDETTADPVGGTIERTGGRLNGVLTENAADIVAATCPSVSASGPVRSYTLPSCPSVVSTAAQAAATSSRSTTAARPSPAGPRRTPSAPTITGRKSRKKFMRGNVHATPDARMRSSVGQ